MRLNFEIPFTCPVNIAGHLAKVFSGEYDVPLKSAKRVIDLGANCGAFSIWATHRWPGCLVDAYEPHPDNFLFLRENLKDYPNVTVHNYAIGTPGMRALYDGKFNGGEASLHTIKNNPYPTGRHVEVHSPLELPEADVIKLDIEGAEIEVLPVLIQAGRKFSAIMLEFHSQDIRRELDESMRDYNLVRADIAPVPNIGTFCFLHKEIAF